MRRGPRTRLRLFRPGPEDAADAEIRHHLDERAERLVEEGWTPDEARAEAERRFGEVARYRRELTRMGRTDEGRKTMTGWIDMLVQDVRYALRNVKRNPGFTTALVVTLGVGIGAATAVFTVLDALLLRPLPYEGPERIVEVSHAADGFTLPFVLWSQVDEWRERGDFLTAMAIYDQRAVVRVDGDHPENLGALAVSHDLDDFLGVRPVLGRAFGADDARPAAPATVMLTQPYWRSLGAPPDIVGREIRLDAGPHTVIGVLPSAFKFPVAGSREVWLPIRSDGTVAGQPLQRASVVGRLRQGTSLEAAQARADRVAAALAEEQPSDFGWEVRLGRITDWRANPDVRQAVWMFAGAVAGMLLIALVNGVNLLLARASARVRELGVRRALGASRARLFVQLLTESVVSGLAAGVVAAALAAMGVAALRRVMPDDFAFSSVYDFSVGPRALGFTFLVSAGVGVVVGLLPAFQRRGEGRLGSGILSARSDGSGERHGLRRLLVVVETALSVALLVGAALLATSFARLTTGDPGFEPDRLVFAEFGLSESHYPTGAERAAFFRELEERVEAIPGVEAATVADGLPGSSGFSFGVSLEAEGRPAPSGEQPTLLPTSTVRSDYLDVLGIPLRAGRNLRPADAGERNVLVDEALANYLWPGESPLGERFRLDENGEWRTVVGVVADQKLMGLDDRSGRFEIFYADPDTTTRAYMGLAVRTGGEPEAVFGDIRRAVRTIDPEQPIREITTARAALSETVAKPRFLMTVMGFLAGAALLLAAVGLYGVLSYVVTRQRREMGIRAALGAGRGRIRGRVLAGGMALAGTGVVVGLGLAMALDRVIQSLLYGVEPGDPTVLAAVATIMLGVAALACWLPARRATRVDPVEVLRSE